MVSVMIIFCTTQVVHAQFRAGVASAVITPQTSIWMSGYGSRDKPSQSVVQGLYTKALAIEDTGGKQVVFLTTDIIGLTAELSDNVAARVSEKTGLPRSAILLTASHTHTGPVVGENLRSMYDLPAEEWEKIRGYTRDLEDKMVNVILSALEQLEPAKMERGNGRAGFAMNRRLFVPGQVVMRDNPIGTVDHDVPVLKVTDAQGDVKAILFGYACHNTTLSDYGICGDYAGYAQEYLEKRHHGAAALFFAGCGADANPSPRTGLEYARQHGEELSQAVETVLNEPMTPVDGTICTAFSSVYLPLTAAPTREELQKQLEDKNRFIRNRAKYLLETLEQNGSIPDQHPCPVQVWGIGKDFLIIALGGEVVSDYSLLFKYQFGKDRTWVAAYANDTPAYIPTIRLIREGGYEVEESMIYYGLHGPWKQEIEPILTEEVNRLVKEVRQAGQK
ncbi:MAG TPA: neutral/alkaline non-lysosomal ceramidase N-terminal domain-containing protein [bacterium]|nr:neutral/alkaline non-lysosomal ceramidase N-terminal domain-containing protein [bacterium]HQL62803.1 neutral/alkaline non-lysosomal ceramidase N-terminal domain-containing protein [bacterium]